MTQVYKSFYILAIGLMALYCGIGGLESFKVDEEFEAAEKAEKSEKTVSMAEYLHWLNGGEISNDPKIWEKTKTFRNLQELETTKRYLQNKRIFKLTTRDVPKTTRFLITAIAFGLLGTIALILKHVVIDDETIKDIKVIPLTLLGAFVGLFVLGISYLVPTVLTTETDSELRPTSLLFFCLFGGFSVERFYAWLQGHINKLFEDRGETTPPPKDDV